MDDKARLKVDCIAPTSETFGNEETGLTPNSDDVEKLKSQVRLCVMRILTERLNRPAGFSEVNNTLVTELILEYLEWMGYNRTLDAFRLECRLPEERNFYVLDQLAQQLPKKGQDILPLIFYVAQSFKEMDK